MNVPILFVVFNRPDTTRVVFEAIRKAKPRQLFIAADGARDKPGEDDRCAEVREIVSKVDWECEVKTWFRTENNGCKIAVSSAIHWFFDHVEEGIILEDDCLPAPSFFTYCGEMLKKYRTDTRIMHISGSNFLFNEILVEHSYYYSKFPAIWGWATWKRAWKLYDIKMEAYPEIKEKKLIQSIYPDPVISKYFLDFFDAVYFERLTNTWGVQWLYSVFSNSGLSITPRANLIKNIGFGPDATHTHSINRCANIPVMDIGDIIHPEYVIVNHKADAILFDNSFDGKRIRYTKTMEYKIKSFPFKIYSKVKNRSKLILMGLMAKFLNNEISPVK